jgi:hypothetical protein
VGDRAHANQRRRCEGACGGCCTEAERGRNGEKGSGLAHAKREGGSSARCVKEDGARQPTIAWVRQRLRSVGHMPREAGEELGAWAAAVVRSAQ